MLKKLKLNGSMKTYKTFHYRGLECKSRKSRNTWGNRQIWPWNRVWSRAKANSVMPRERTGHSKHPLPTTQEKTLHMDITRWSIQKSNWLYSLQPEMEKVYAAAAAAAAKLLQSCLTLCDRRDGSPPDSPVPGILQARTLEGVAISFFNAWRWKVKVTVKSCPTLHDPRDCSLPGSSIHGIFQARVLEWVAIASMWDECNCAIV